VELFLSNKPRLEELCKEEISSLEKESILDLIEILKNKDEKSNKTDNMILRKAISEYIKTYRLEFGDVKVDGNRITRLGDEYSYQSGIKPGDLKIKTLDIKGSSYTYAGYVFYRNQGARGMYSYRKNTKPSQSHTKREAEKTVPENEIG
jgi:hypothetical protein